MAGALDLCIGSVIAVLGFLVMRNPMLLTLLAPGAEGYYQRMVLDRFQRIQMRMLGMVLSFFGLVVATSALSGPSSSKIFGTISNGMLVLLWLSFISGFVFGITYAVVQIFRGRWKELLFGWMGTYRRGIELGPISVHPAITPRMRKESIAFTVVYCCLLGMAFVFALTLR